MAKTVTIKLHSQHLTLERLKAVYHAKALPILAEQIKDDCNVYVREQEGILKQSATVENGGKQIVWSTPYAAKVYYTGTPRKNVNPKASLRWCEVATRQFSKQWAAQATRLVGGD